MDIPVYIFVGFLDSGKTKFMQETLEDPRFYDNERTLIIQCEEGEEELTPSKFPSNDVFIHSIESIEEIETKQFKSLQKKYRMNRVVIEYNGMWKLDNLFSALPENWVVYQIMMSADSTTFITYNNNMRDLVVDKLKYSEMVVFNRLKDGDDLMQFHKIARAASRSIAIAYEYENGEVTFDEFEDPLPFNIEDDIIEIKDIDYAIWYRDLMEETDKYNGKTVKFKGIAVKNNQLPEDTFAIGRHIMTCCVDDITFGGLIAKWDKSNTLKSKDWVSVTAKISIEYNPSYESKGPVLYVSNADITLPPKQELATFN